jgi:hypothetical protein
VEELTILNHAGRGARPVKQTVARNRFQIFQFSLCSVTLRHGHICPPRVMTGRSNRETLEHCHQGAFRLWLRQGYSHKVWM